MGALLAHAQNLGNRSSAPVSSLLTEVDRAGHLPWPDELAMRRGVLWSMQGDVQPGQTGTIGQGELLFIFLTTDFLSKESSARSITDGRMISSRSTVRDSVLMIRRRHAGRRGRA